MGSLPTDLIIWIVTLILGVVITIVATEPIHYVLARILGLWTKKPPRGVKGIWSSVYTYGSSRPKHTESHLVELRQFGNYVIGRVIAGQSHSHTFKGKIQHEIFFTGTWETDIKGEIYHGAFQFAIDVKGKEMKGKWVGFNSRHQVDTGDWEWALLSDNVDSTTKHSLIAEFDKH